MENVQPADRSFGHGGTLHCGLAFTTCSHVPLNKHEQFHAPKRERPVNLKH